jgi:hypothetical protein
MNDPNRDEIQKAAERDRQDREKMTARGHDPDNPATFAKFQNVQSRVALGQITENEASREMASHEALKADKEVRATAKQRALELPRGSSEGQELGAQATEKQRSWRDRLLRQSESQQQIQQQTRETRDAQPRPAGEPRENTAKEKEIEVDWRRAAIEVTDRRQLRPERERGEQTERTQDPQGPPRRPGGHQR